MDVVVVEVNDDRNYAILCDHVAIVPNPHIAEFYKDIEYRIDEKPQNNNDDIPIATNVNDVIDNNEPIENISGAIVNIQPDNTFNQNRNVISQSMYIYISVVLAIMGFVVIVSIIIILM